MSSSLSANRGKAKIRRYVENYTMYRNLSKPEWNMLRGKASNKELQSMRKKEIEVILK